jgi:DNA-binding NarL/FixJ family response regulator
MNPNVLIVDDHPTFRLTARLLLESEGYRVVGEAEDGITAVRKARELRPELVLLDVNLPDIDGFDVAARLSSDEDAPMIVLISSRDPADFGPLIERSGARGFIPKEDLSGERIRALTG